MSRTWIVLLVAAFLLLWAARTASQEGSRVHGDPNSLKLYDNLRNAIEIARDWERDALLVGIEAAEVKEDGTVDIIDPTRAGFIAYRFFSPAVLSRMGREDLAHRQVVLRNGMILLMDDDGNRSLSPLPEGFRDLDEVWQSARRKGAHGRAEVTLQYRDGAEAHPYCFLFVAGPTILRIDARTCEVVDDRP